ncbi:hypothetical protein [uncultured phage cr106_1]|uniref:Uncharacterized protein n=1 Tax=uncultured phage cr106_1 TaxID=2772062 RepID=A0A7M1RWP8_9CAUD|nr:hypothetical protein KNV29_gp095 [uncultured phage cr106_1]QOR58292.1 hypothetical protein [uncultured phage cr106_1]
MGQLTLKDVRNIMLSRLQEMEEKEASMTKEEKLLRDKKRQESIKGCESNHDSDRYVYINGREYIDHGW